jgi:hypothetical protein
MSRLALIVTAGLLAVALLAGCSSPSHNASPAGFVPTDTQGIGSATSWQPTLLGGLGDPATSGLDAWPKQFDAAPKAYDIDGDGVDELIAMASDTKVYVFRALTGEVLARLPTTYPPGWYIERVLNSVEAGVLRPGEAPSLVVSDHAGYVAVWRFDPAGSTQDSFKFDRQFDVHLDECHDSPGMDAKPAIGDLDGDGTLEIVLQTEETGFYALRADGSTLWRQCWGGGNSAPVIADVDGDGKPEVVIASDGGFVSVLTGATGNAQWTFDATKLGITPASITVSPTVADLDGVGGKEILFTTRNAPDGDFASFASDHMAIMAVHQDPLTRLGTLVWLVQPEWANPLSATQLVVHDVDGDGRADIFGMDWNTIGHFPGDWERLGPAHLFRLDSDGRQVWMREMDSWWSNQDIALADLDGDGSLSVLANGPAGVHDGIWRMSASTGAAEGFLALDGWKGARGPQLFDLRHDGQMELVFPVAADDGGAQRGAILVFDLGTAFDAPWRGSS